MLMHAGYVPNDVCHAMHINLLLVPMLLTPNQDDYKLVVIVHPLNLSVIKPNAHVNFQLMSAKLLLAFLNLGALPIHPHCMA